MGNEKIVITSTTHRFVLQRCERAFGSLGSEAGGGGGVAGSVGVGLTHRREVVLKREANLAAVAFPDVAQLKTKSISIMTGRQSPFSWLSSEALREEK